MLYRLSVFWARCEIAVAALLAGMITVLILINVATRSARMAIYWIDEAAIYTMIWMTFLAASAAVHDRSAVAVTLVGDMLSDRAKARLVAVLDLVRWASASRSAGSAGCGSIPRALRPPASTSRPSRATPSTSSTRSRPRRWDPQGLGLADHDPLHLRLPASRGGQPVAFASALAAPAGAANDRRRLLVLLFAGVPISLVLCLSAVWYIQASGNTVLYSSFAQQLFAGVESYGLLAIPLFMLTGELMNEGGLTQRLIQAARVFVGGFRGGLAYINLLANMFMAAIIGSAASQIAVMSRAMVPAMEEEGYRREFAAATTAAGGLLSPIIPPSMLFVIYGVLAQIPIGDMFMAGILPGLLLSASFFVIVALVGLKEQFPKGEWMSPAVALAAIRDCLPAALIPLAIVGGILLGVATPTESAAVASLVAFVIGRFVYGELKITASARSSCAPPPIPAS